MEIGDLKNKKYMLKKDSNKKEKIIKMALREFIIGFKRVCTVRISQVWQLPASMSHLFLSGFRVSLTNHRELIKT